MSDLFPVTLEDMLREVERELVLRQRVYPRWVATGKMKSQQALRQIEVMAALADRLRKEFAA